MQQYWLLKRNHSQLYWRGKWFEKLWKAFKRPESTYWKVSGIPVLWYLVADRKKLKNYCLYKYLSPSRTKFRGSNLHWAKHNRELQMKRVIARLAVQWRNEEIRALKCYTVLNWKKPYRFQVMLPSFCRVRMTCFCLTQCKERISGLGLSVAFHRVVTSRQPLYPADLTCWNGTVQFSQLQKITQDKQFCNSSRLFVQFSG